jgi:hypothetical protein
MKMSFCQKLLQVELFIQNRNGLMYCEIELALEHHTQIKASAGIPNFLPTRIWLWLVDVKDTIAKYEKDIYKRLASFVNPLWLNEIKKDVQGTMVESSFF